MNSKHFGDKQFVLYNITKRVTTIVVLAADEEVESEEQEDKSFTSLASNISKTGTLLTPYSSNLSLTHNKK